MRLGARAGIAVVLALAVLAVPAGALAAAPANDNFANREVPNESLPIEVMGSNVEATSEPGEPTSGTYGHSVWFEWVAPATGWFTFGACDSDFPAGVKIFTGTELGSLAPTDTSLGAEGPGCGNQAQYTFHASAGTAYMVQVDGRAIA